MTRVYFTAGDVARTRFCASPAPLVEAVLSLAELRRRPPAAYARWHGQARRAFPATARPLLDLMPVTGYWPEFLDPVVADLDQGLEMVCATPRRVLRAQVARCWQRAARPPSWLRALADGEPEALETVQRGLRDLHAACVAPRWPEITASVRANVARQAAIVAAGGLADLFTVLHPDLVWRDGSLERTWRTAELWLDGSGLQLVPSASWSGPPLFTIGPRQLGDSALIYPAWPAGTMGRCGEARDLAGLLGRTRAAALRALRDPCGTTDLAARLEISAASASEHVTALRRADLAQTVRCGRGVRHSLTPLGQAMLDEH